MSILLVEENRKLADAMRRELEAAGLAVDVVADGGEADGRAIAPECDLILLGTPAGGGDALALLRGWRAHGLRGHVLVLSARAGYEAAVRALNAGADDCLPRPFAMRELVARARALLRRRYRTENPFLRVRDLVIDVPGRTVKRAGKLIRLTAKEFALLEFLARHRGRVVTREMLWGHLYDERDECTSNILEVFVRQLRIKIDRGFDVPLILTRWGEGYLLRGEDEADLAGSRGTYSAAGRR